MFFVISSLLDYTVASVLIETLVRMTKHTIAALAVAITSLTGTMFPSESLTAAVSNAFEPAAGSQLIYSFNAPGVVHEAASMKESWSPYWWLAAGGRMEIADHVGRTVYGALPSSDTWNQQYARWNPLDTSNGLYPQNIFRLVSKSYWKDVDQSVLFQMNGVNMTDTPNRDGYSGVLLMSRYVDQYSLYYAGVRMDGDVVIKKKYKGTYHTLAQKSHFSSSQEYNKYTNPSIIPMNRWIGMRSVTKTNSNGTVSIDLYLDETGTGNSWKKVLSVVDQNTGSAVIDNVGHVGIRTDYANVQFDNYRIKEL
jgi:hypothetical protein